jgi:hypothetical protein
MRCPICKHEMILNRFQTAYWHIPGHNCKCPIFSILVQNATPTNSVQTEQPLAA